MDKRDSSGTYGIGSRGSFFGQKTSITCGCNCVPLNSETKSGNTSDIALFHDTIAPVFQLSQATSEKIWIITCDAGYSSTYLIDDVKNAGSIPFFDINPRASKRLKALKDAVTQLQEFSKIAIRYGLTLEQRKKWISEIRDFELKNYGKLNLDMMEKELKRVLKNWADYARYHGLSAKEQQKEWALRKKIEARRRDIRFHGTIDENKIGCTLIMQGTIEWFLVYHIRGQNEGINGILKKKGPIIGDGQHTSWLRRTKIVRNRIQSEIALIQTSAIVYYLVTDKLTNPMFRIYHWSVSFFIIFFVEDLVEYPP